jgi:hypothetical protein
LRDALRELLESRKLFGGGGCRIHALTPRRAYVAPI